MKVGTMTATASSDGRSVAAMMCAMNAKHSGMKPRNSSQRAHDFSRILNQLASTMQPKNNMIQSISTMSTRSPAKPGKSTSFATSMHGELK